MKFTSASEVRAFCKANGFPKISVRYSNNPFGGEGKFFVRLTDIPVGVTVIHSSGGSVPTTNYSDDKDVATRLNNLREILKTTENARSGD